MPHHGAMTIDASASDFEIASITPFDSKGNKLTHADADGSAGVLTLHDLEHNGDYTFHVKGADGITEGEFNIAIACSSDTPTSSPSKEPTSQPSSDPTTDPTEDPTADPTADPTRDPTADPTSDPTSDPTAVPTADPTSDPTDDPTQDPTADPSRVPSAVPSADPSSAPTRSPSADPTSDPTADPTQDPTADPTRVPSAVPSADPTSDPTSDPTMIPSAVPTADPTAYPTNDPSSMPSSDPTALPTQSPTFPEGACDQMTIEQTIEARVTNLLQTDDSSLIALSSICEEAFRIAIVSLSADVSAWASEWCFTADVSVRSLLDDDTSTRRRLLNDAFLITAFFGYGEALDVEISKYANSEVADEFGIALASLMVSDEFIALDEDIGDVEVKDAVNSETAVASDGLATSLTSGESLSQLGWIIVAFAAGVVLLCFISFWLILRKCGAKTARNQEMEMVAAVTPGLTPGTTPGGGQTEAGAMSNDGDVV